MGYQTYFTLDWEFDPTKPLEQIITEAKASGRTDWAVLISTDNYEVMGITLKEALSEISDYGMVDIFDGYGEHMKWYHHSEDMKALSTQFPNVLFTVHGQGEEAGDLWYEWFLGGKSQQTIAQITYEDFDRDKLT